MTRDELTAISKQALEKLPADEREIIVNHFGTGDPSELAARLAAEAEDLWSPDESQVEAKDWAATHLALLLDMHRDNQQSMLQAQRRKVAQELVDALTPERRALYCWHLHTTRRRRVIALTVATAIQALDEGFVDEGSSFPEAVTQIIEHGIEAQIVDVEDAYFSEQGTEALPPPATVEGDRASVQPVVQDSAPAGKNVHEPPATSTRRAETSPQPAMHRHAVAGWPPMAMASADRTRRSAAHRPATGRTDWDAIAAETERRVTEKESELVATMDRLTRIYSGGRLAGRRVRPGTIVVERVSGTPEFPSLVLPSLADIADGFDVGAAVAIVGLMPLEVAPASWLDPGGKPTPEGDRLTAALEASGAAYRAGRASPAEFEATRDALWEEAERVGVAVEVAWRLHSKWGEPTPREPAVPSSLPPVPVRAMPHLRHSLELYLRPLPTDAYASVISRWIRPSNDQIEAGQGAWQNVLELVRDHSTCSHCPFVLGSNLDCETCRAWVLSLKRPGTPWTAERIGAALYNCDEPAVAIAAVEALAQSTQAPLTAAFFQDFADNFEVRLTKHVKRPEDMSPGYRDHCRKAVEWLLPQPEFPLPEYPPSKGAPRSVASVDILMRAAPVSARWRY